MVNFVQIHFFVRSNDDDDRVFFTLVSGRTKKTNKDGTFRLLDDPNSRHRVNIYVAKSLDYEKVPEYMLTLQVSNAPGLVAEAQLQINVKVSLVVNLSIKTGRRTLEQRYD